MARSSIALALCCLSVHAWPHLDAAHLNLSLCVRDEGSGHMRDEDIARALSMDVFLSIHEFSPALHYRGVSQERGSCGEPAEHGSAFVLRFDCQDAIVEQLVPALLSERFRESLAATLDVRVLSMEVTASSSPVGGSNGNLTICGQLPESNSVTPSLGAAEHHLGMREKMIHPLTALAVAEDLESHFGFTFTSILKIEDGSSTCSLGPQRGHLFWIGFSARGSAAKLAALRQVAGEASRPPQLLGEFVRARRVHVLWLRLLWDAAAERGDTSLERGAAVNMTFVSDADAALSAELAGSADDPWVLPLLVSLVAGAALAACVACLVVLRSGRSKDEEKVSMKAHGEWTGGDARPASLAIGVESFDAQL